MTPRPTAARYNDWREVEAPAPEAFAPALPASVAVDAAGNLYIADKDNQRIRKVDTGGAITTVAGTGGHGYSGDGVAAIAAQLYEPGGVAMDAAGNLYIADTRN